MKFEKQFKLYKIPEWSAFYLDYKGLKYILQFLDKRRKKKIKVAEFKMIKYTKEPVPKNPLGIKRTKSFAGKSIMKLGVSPLPVVDPNEKKRLLKEKLIRETEDLSIYSNEEMFQRFMTIYDSKLDYISEFFLNKLEEYLKKFSALKGDIATVTKEAQETDYLNSREEFNNEEDILGYAVSWKRAFSSLYNETSWLHSFHSINKLAVAKIKKKSIKILKFYSLGVDLYQVFDDVEKQIPFFFPKSLNKLIELRKNIKKLYSETFTNGNYEKASNELEKRLKGLEGVSQPYFICLYSGFIISCLIFYIIIKDIDVEKSDIDTSIVPFFPAFNFALNIILSFLFLAIDIVILQYYQINYIYIFEINNKNRVKPFKIFQITLKLFSIWLALLLLMKMSLKYGIFGRKFYLFPLFIIGFLCFFFFYPFHVLNYDFRKGLIKVFIRNLFPIGKNTVRFKDFFFGNILTSLSSPFKSLILSFCLSDCIKCALLNKRGGGCSRETIPCLIISAYPYFIRFTQCINKLYYTGKKWPHLGNMIKYAAGVINNIISWLYDREEENVALKVLFISYSIIYQGYNVFWDIYVDWGCGRCQSSNFFLRDKLTYPKPCYYLVILNDTIIRFRWTWNFIKIKDSLKEWKHLLTSGLEVFRRACWALLRIENERLSNPEHYRTILAIPDLAL